MRKFGKCFLVVFLLLLLTDKAVAFESKAKQAILIEIGEEQALYAKNADELMPPSSMSKLMTTYLTFRRLKEGGLKLTDTLPVSEKAWRKGGSKMFVEVNKDIAVEDLLRGVIIQSGNDACIVLAEGLAGSEDAFAEEMNLVAEEIGLQNSHFVNATGWPDEEHKMTARDLAILGKRLIEDFPEYYAYFAEEEFTYHGITQPNRNGLLGKMGIDGLKTGHTEAAGYGIVVSATKDGRRLVAVVNGLSSERERLQEAEKLIRYGFSAFRPLTVFRKGQEIGDADVWFGKEEAVSLTVKDDISVLVPWLRRKEMNITMHYRNPVEAPVAKGQEVGLLRIQLPGGEDNREYPLLAGESVERLSPAARILPALEYYFITRPVTMREGTAVSKPGEQAGGTSQDKE